MSRKRGFATQMIRHLIQLAAFVLSPGLFIVVFGAVRDILRALISGSFSVAGLASQLVTVFAVFLMTALWGRFFCGFLCSFGTTQELIFGLTEKWIAKKVRLSAGTDCAMKFVKYFILVFVVAGVWVLALPVDDSFNPWGVFGMLVSGNFSLISASVPTAGFALLLAICFGSLLVERFFCRYLCPLGAMFAIVSGKRLYKIKRESATCTNCGLCVRKCSMGIKIPEKAAVTSGECIQCMKCLDMCPKESLSVNPAGAIAGTAAAAAMGGMVAVGNLIPVPVTAKVMDEQFEEASVKGQYKDGVYTGAGTGFRGSTEVQVTVENGYIADITVLSFEDDREFFGKAQSAVISEIIAGQTFDVAPVSGATFSSNSIMEAVASALGNGAGSPTQLFEEGTDSGTGQQAGEGNGFGAGQEVGEGTGAGAGPGSGEGNETGGGQSDGNGDRVDAGQQVGDGTAFGTDQGATGIEEEKKDYDMDQSGGESRQSEDDTLTELDNEAGSDTASGGFALSDGVYEGTGRGLRGNTKVSVTVEEGAIADITILSFEDDDAFFNRAKNAVISEIIRTQSPDVVPVSGATFSSNSIMEAVASALGNGAGSPTQPLEEGTDSGTGQQAGEGNGFGAGQGDGEGNGTESGNGSEAGQGSGAGNGAGAGQGSGAGNGYGHGHGRHGGGRRGKGGQNK